MPKVGWHSSKSPICSLTSYVRWIIYKSKIDAIGKCMEGQSCVLSSSIASDFPEQCISLEVGIDFLRQIQLLKGLRTISGGEEIKN